MGGVLGGAAVAAIAIVLLWGLGWVEPPEALSRSLARRSAVSGGSAAEATVEAIPCPPLRRLRLYLVCTRGCSEVWRVVGVRGLRPILLSNPGRVPPEPPEEAQRRINDALAGEGLVLDETGARAMIGCHMALAGMYPDLIVNAMDRLRIEQAAGDEDRLREFAESLLDPAAIERIRVNRAGDRWEATFDYWATELPDRPVYTLRVVLEADGRLDTVETLPAGLSGREDG